FVYRRDSSSPSVLRYPRFWWLSSFGWRAVLGANNVNIVADRRASCGSSPISHRTQEQTEIEIRQFMLPVADVVDPEDHARQPVAQSGIDMQQMISPFAAQDRAAPPR